MAPRPEAPVPYGGPVPPGGWQQPPARQVGRLGGPAARELVEPRGRRPARLADPVRADRDPRRGSWWPWRSTAAAPSRSWAWSLAIARLPGRVVPLRAAADGARRRAQRPDLGQADRGHPGGARHGRRRWTSATPSCARSWSSGCCSASIGGFFFIPTLLDWLWPLWDDENRALHDMLVSSHVVRDLAPAAAQAAAGRTRSAAPVQIISSRAGPTPTITIGMPRKSLMKSR